VTAAASASNVTGAGRVRPSTINPATLRQRSMPLSALKCTAWTLPGSPAARSASTAAFWAMISRSGGDALRPRRLAARRAISAETWRRWFSAALRSRGLASSPGVRALALTGARKIWRTRTCGSVAISGSAMVTSGMKGVTSSGRNVASRCRIGPWAPQPSRRSARQAIRLRLDGLGGLVRDLTAISPSALVAAA
jgi:hypothetical protein